MKLHFTLYKQNPWNTATLMSQFGKSNRMDSKAWNTQFPDGSVKSTDFERDVTILEKFSDSMAIERDEEDIFEEIGAHTYILVR